MPATHPDCPFPRHEPSVYTTSSATPNEDDLIVLEPLVDCDSDSAWVVDGGLIVDFEDTGARPLGREPIKAPA